MKIITKEGEGRPINPYYNNANDLYEDKNRRFNILNPPLQVYDIEGNLYIGEGEVEAELIYKYFSEIFKENYFLPMPGNSECEKCYRICAPVKQEKETVEEIAEEHVDFDDTKCGKWFVSGAKFGANWQLKQSNLIDRDEVIELINQVSKTFTGPDATLALFKAITKIKEL